MERHFDEKTKSWRDEYNRRICTHDDDLIKAIAENCVEFITKRKTIYLHDVTILLEKALEGVENKKDLTPSEEMAIKSIRNMIKGL